MKRDRPVKPAFAPWMCRLDPTLERQHDNELFRFFHEYRARRRTSPFVAMLGNQKLIMTGAMPADREIWLALVVALVFSLLTCGVMLLPLCFFLTSFRCLTVYNSPKFPLQLDRGFHEGGIHRQFATDLWMSRVTGREVLEANYLEAQEATYQFVLVMLLVPVFLLVAHYWGEEWLMVWTQPAFWFMVACVLAGAVVFLQSMVLFGIAFNAFWLEEKLVYYSSRNLIETVLRRGARNLFFLVWFVLFAVFVYLVPLMFLLEAIDAGFEGGVAFFSLYTAAWTRAVTTLKRPMYLDRLERMLGMADEAWCEVMERRVLGTREPAGAARKSVPVQEPAA